MADFSVQLINLSAYYQVHDVLEISHRYEHEMLYGIMTLLLLVIVSNESRYAPSEPIIADTVSYCIAVNALIDILILFDMSIRVVSCLVKPGLRFIHNSCFLGYLPCWKRETTTHLTTTTCSS